MFPELQANIPTTPYCISAITSMRLLLVLVESATLKMFQRILMTVFMKHSGLVHGQSVEVLVNFLF